MGRTPPDLGMGHAARNSADPVTGKSTIAVGDATTVLSECPLGQLAALGARRW